MSLALNNNNEFDILGLLLGVIVTAFICYIILF